MGSNICPNRVIAKDVKSCTYCSYVSCTTLIVWGMSLPKTGGIQYHAQLGLPDKGRAIKGLVVCNSWDLEPWNLLSGPALGCYQPSPEVWLVNINVPWAKDFFVFSLKSILYLPKSPILVLTSWLAKMVLVVVTKKIIKELWRNIFKNPGRCHSVKINLM